MASCHVRSSANQILAAPRDNCQRDSATCVELKTAYLRGNLLQPLLKFNIGTILTYFIDVRVDFKAIRENADELFVCLHWQFSRG